MADIDQLLSALCGATTAAVEGATKYHVMSPEYGALEREWESAEQAIRDAFAEQAAEISRLRSHVDLLIRR